MNYYDEAFTSYEISQIKKEMTTLYYVLSIAIDMTKKITPRESECDSDVIRRTRKFFNGYFCEHPYPKNKPSSNMLENLSYEFAEEDRALQIVSVLNTLRQIRNAVQRGGITFVRLTEEQSKRKDDKGCTRIILASASVPLSNDIIIPRIIKLSAFNFTSNILKNEHTTLMGNLVHEISHIVAQTKDHKYGQLECISKLSAEQKINNADNYGFYVELFLHPSSRNIYKTLYFYPVSAQYRSFSPNARTQSSRIYTDNPLLTSANLQQERIKSATGSLHSMSETRQVNRGRSVTDVPR